MAIYYFLIKYTQYSIYVLIFVRKIFFYVNAQVYNLNYRLKTNNDVEQKLWSFAGHCRFVWNYFWRLNKYRLSRGYRIMRYSEMDYFSKLLKKSDEYGFIAEAPAHLIQQKLPKNSFKFTFFLS